MAKLENLAWVNGGGDAVIRHGIGRPLARRDPRVGNQETGMIKQQFTLYMENKPGELARITKKLAAARVNLEGISVANSADVALVQLVVSNATATRRILKAGNVPFTVQQVALVPLHNEPGSLAKVAESLAQAKININYVYATSCNCGNSACSCYAVISAPDLRKVEEAWQV